MTNFEFDQLPSGQLVQVRGDDTIHFHGGSASSTGVTFGMVFGDIFAVDVSFRGHTVQFDGGVIDTSASMNLIFDDGSHLLIGDFRNDVLEGGAGSDALYGGNGNDSLAGHGGENLLQGNQGNDTISAESGADTIYGGQGDDVIVSGLGVGLEHGDVVNGNKGADSITGSSANDTLLGGQDNDVILGGGGADWISGDRGNDTVSGGAGGDAFSIGANPGDDDRILDFNGAEGDRLHVQAGTALELHQVGADTLIIVNHGSSTVTLAGVQASTLDPNWIVTDGGGAGGGDTIIGSEVTDILIGDVGADSIQGGGGGDWIFGGLGDDTLQGGAGGDAFFGAAHAGDDRVLDFNGAEGDRVRVQAGVAFDVHQDGADTLVIIDHGSSTLRLVGVQMSTLHADWIVGV